MRGTAKASGAHNGNLGDQVADFLEAFVWPHMEESTKEANSTEEMCYKMRQLNKRIDELEASGEHIENLAVRSVNVDALFPSLDVDTCAKIVREQIEKSEMRTNVNGNELTLMIAGILTQEEINKEGIEKYINKRKYKMGARPTIVSVGITGFETGRIENDS